MHPDYLLKKVVATSCKQALCLYLAKRLNQSYLEIPGLLMEVQLFDRVRRPQFFVCEDRRRQEGIFYRHVFRMERQTTTI